MAAARVERRTVDCPDRAHGRCPCADGNGRRSENGRVLARPAKQRDDGQWAGGSWWIICLLVVSLISTWGDAAARAEGVPRLVGSVVAYHPRGFAPADLSQLAREDVVADLRLLRGVGFRGLVTYAATGVLGSVPELARQEGYDGTIIMGIWDPFSEEERRNAVAQAAYVDGYCVGNEGLGIRYEPEGLAGVMAELRRASGLPVTTSEPIDSYLRGPHREWLLANSDWLFPLAHPFWAARIDTREAVDWIVARHDFLAATTGRQVILKEAGVPSGGVDGYQESSQIVFFDALEATGVPFFYFEAFDQPWKRYVLKFHEAEAHWGIFRADGTPKEVASWLVHRPSQR